jgi:two-component system response regulator AtoC
MVTEGVGMDQKVVLVVDDEETLRGFLAELLSMAGYQVRTAAGGQQALEMLSGGAFDAVLLDVVLPDLSGLEVLRRYRARGGAAPVVVLSALAGADDAVRAMKMGATDYISKPFERVEIEAALARALGRPVPAAAAEETGVVIRPPGADPESEEPEARQLIYLSSAMRRAKGLVDQIADTDVPVLILGESGVGKEVIAREIHARSRRHGKPFIKINCAALPAELLESELFGHERGAFTGATAEKPGKFELADQGTIFLDEIGEMAIRLQAKLLQVLQDEEFFRVGGKKSVRVDSRVVVATNRELEREIEAGNFREDLFYRLNVVSIRIAPLRERKEDIPPLVEHFLRKYGRKYRGGVAELPRELLEAFGNYEWPGNVRELENMVRRLVVLGDAGLVLDELRAGGRTPASAPSLPAAHAGEGPGLYNPPVRALPQGQNAVRTHAPEEGPFGPAVQPVAPPPRPEPAPEPAPRYVNPFAVPQPPPPPLTISEDEMSLKDIGRRAAMLAEREAILSMLQRTAWNKRRAAGKLRISYKALLYKIKECGIIDPRSNAEF